MRQNDLESNEKVRRYNNSWSKFIIDVLPSTTQTNAEPTTSSSTLADRNYHSSPSAPWSIATSWLFEVKKQCSC